jgi:tetratricopeptide (TPR) repeat protein
MNGWIKSHLLISVLAMLITFSCSLAQAQQDRENPRLGDDPRLTPGQIAPVLEGLGDHHHKVTANSDRAQLFFDQGLKMAYAFNHHEAARSFKEAIRLDPDCAMAYWGLALVTGPNLNLPMQESQVAPAYEAIQKAVSLKRKVSKAERDYIEALAIRYADTYMEDRSALDLAYAEAMNKLIAKYPNDTDALTLYADAMMNTMPWDYWTNDGRARAGTQSIVDALELAIKLDPKHPGAHHYYIHITEAFHPEMSIASADAMTTLMPGAGHMVHMPSHIYVRVGRYAEATQSNIAAAKADEGYITQCRAQGMYPAHYYPHNVHFIVHCAVFEGNSSLSITSAKKVAMNAADKGYSGEDWALHQTFQSLPLYTLARFGKWDEILEVAEPNEDLTFLRGIWHYARGMALARTEMASQASDELRQLIDIAEDPSMAERIIGFSNGGVVLTIATHVLAGEIAATQKDYDTAISHLSRAVRLEDSMLYAEPPDWPYPVRHSLGAVLLEAGQPVEAEAVYWDELRKNPENGYSLYGVWQCMQATGNPKADEIKARFDEAWTGADIALTGSRF